MNIRVILLFLLFASLNSVIATQSISCSDFPDDEQCIDRGDSAPQVERENFQIDEVEESIVDAVEDGFFEEVEIDFDLERQDEERKEDEWQGDEGDEISVEEEVFIEEEEIAYQPTFETESRKYAYFVHSMNDELRNEAYLGALRKVMKPNSTVLDLNAGLGLFSMSASRSGARVVAVEPDNYARDLLEAILEDNSFSQNITLLSSFDPADRLANETFDVILFQFLTGSIFDSPVIGFSGLLHELGVIKSTTVMIPSKFKLSFSIVNDKRFSFASKVRGFNYSFIRDLVHLTRRNAEQQDMREFRIISDTIEAIEIDLYNRTSWILPFEKTLKFTVTKHDANAIACGILIWWEALMDKDGEFIYSNKPTQSLDKQVFLTPYYVPFVAPEDVSGNVSINVKIGVFDELSGFYAAFAE